MRLGIDIILHALRMVWDNQRAALRIGLIPVVLMIFATIVLRAPGTPVWSMENARSFLQVMMGAFSSESGFLLMLIWGFASVWTFVNWHRFILLAEYPTGWVPPIRHEAGIAYAMAALKLIGIWVVAMFIVVFVVALAFPRMDWILWAVNLALVFLVFRFSPILPAAALGRKMGLGQALVATGSASLAIGVIIGARYGVDRVVQAIVSGAADINQGLGLILWAALTLVLSLVNVSILTTLYGVCVEGRSLR